MLLLGSISAIIITLVIILIIFYLLKCRKAMKIQKRIENIGTNDERNKENTGE